MDKIKILLTSDMHMGKPLNLPGICTELRQQTLKKIFKLAGEHDILLVAGDFIELSSIDNSLMDEIKENFAILAEKGIEIYYTPGKSELDQEGNVHSSLTSVSEKINIFSDINETRSYRSQKGDIIIHGIQAGSRFHPSEVLTAGKKSFNIGLFHKNFSPHLSETAVHGHITKEDLKSLRFDFYAMGMNHSFKVFRSMDRIIGAYAGSPEPCSITETGDRFVLSLITEGHHLKSIKRIQVNSTSIANLHIDCKEFNSAHDLISHINAKTDEKNIYSVTLDGMRSFKIEELLKDYAAETGRHLKITDNSVPDLDMQFLSGNEKPNSFYSVILDLMKDISTEDANRDAISRAIYNSFGKGKNRGTEYCSF